MLWYAYDPPSHKHFDPWDVEYLLTLIEINNIYIYIYIYIYMFIY